MDGCGDDQHDAPMLSTIGEFVNVCGDRTQLSQRSSIADHNPPCHCIFSRLIILIPSCLPHDRIVSSIPLAPTSSSLSRPMCFKISIFYRSNESTNMADHELIEAAAENDLPEVRRLVSVGADVNAKQDNFDRTPLSEASLMGHVQVVKEML
jgi:hypothetical protein